MVDPKIGETVYDPAAGTAGFLVAAYEHIRLANSSDAGIEEIELDGKPVRRGHGDRLSQAMWNVLGNATFTGMDVDARMVRLGTMNLTLRGLPDVHILRRNALTQAMDRAEMAELGLPLEGFDVVLANPPFSGKLDKDRVVEDVKVGTTTATEILFVKHMMNSLKAPPESGATAAQDRQPGRCGVIVPEGVLFGSTGAHRELRRQLLENNTVDAVMSLPGGVFNPYSGVKTSVLLFTRGGATGRVLFLHVENDGYKLDANHDTPISADDLPGVATAFARREECWREWQARDPGAEWTEKWWFASAADIRAADFNMSAGRYRPQGRAQVEHRDPLELLDELKAIETEILEEIDALSDKLKERAE
jgi:type I restriction enzyme M protein